MRKNDDDKLMTPEQLGEELSVSQTRAMLKRWIEENGFEGDDLLFPGRD